ncbi:MAG: flagellar basal body L-ring protein FlgH [Chitinivibrionia bacterium]|nr:flagellar basal body L-ring protein FlgH [Chitinivibrionia bacterium]
MKNSVILLTAAVFINAVSAANVYSLYTDRKAMRQGDILTVLISENAEAGTKSTTNTEKTNGYNVKNNAGVGSLKLIPRFEASGELGTNYDGKGTTTRKGNLIAKITVSIDEVFDNGNLLISGSKVVMVNEEKEIISITGIVRPQDIESDNTVYSHKVANSEITYSGKGSASSAQRPGPIARFFNWLF